ncbi:hypothetical protein [Vibrio sp. SCSIO 43137]|uniref:hypothetical protein n=1 Tax=Vibrio sp. SCSIO 43137 TaxID=3021011 RepID=UPI002306FC5A|nr:hypothetical protein [Vibrio sp. SCSIO 43137]WCE28803.1 hypothetical protein PK654_10575 [Vibrio sp. SCSIO 43137]
MARPKSYTDEDIIDIANQLSTKGRKPTAWLIKEALGRGKIAAIQADLDRLIKDGKISDRPKQPTENANSDHKPAASTFELPAELQELLVLKEKELGKMLRDMTVGLNDKAHVHYETLMDVRIRELDIQSEAMEKAKAIAEQGCLDMEARLRKQVEQNELLEEHIENLEVRLSDSKAEKSELALTIGQLTESFNKATEKAEQQQSLLDRQRQTISEIDKEHTATQVKLECSTEEARNLQSQLSGLSENLEKTKAQLIEASTRLKSTQELLIQSESQVIVLKEENRELTANNRLLEKDLKSTENKNALLNEQILQLEGSIAEHEVTATLNESA